MPQMSLFFILKTLYHSNIKYDYRRTPLNAKQKMPTLIHSKANTMHNAYNKTISVTDFPFSQIST